MKALVPDTRFAALHEALPEWAELDATLFANLHRHGDCGRWQAALDCLPAAHGIRTDYGDVVAVAGGLVPDHRTLVREALQALHPWRKGPFDLFGVRVDAEWRSDLKWRRVAPAVDLAGAHVLDVGCGNGYYGWRMLQAGASLLESIEPFAAESIQRAFRKRADELEVKAGSFFGPIRGAISGKKVSPPLFESIEALGRDETLRRIGRATLALDRHRSSEG